MTQPLDTGPARPLLILGVPVEKIAATSWRIADALFGITFVGGVLMCLAWWLV